MEYTFADGTKAFCGFRRINKTRTDFATFVHGTKCAAQFSGKTHAATVHLVSLEGWHEVIDKADVVHVCAPPAVHETVAIQALQHNKFAIVEKPLSHNVFEGRKLVIHISPGTTSTMNHSMNSLIPSSNWGSYSR